ncbi:MAG: hypothetical protein D6707_12390 [Bacteroidetes bacterium]|nr:MAG: hypothetical protein D6707_12390 [Bacteroidota bacterium]
MKNYILPLAIFFIVIIGYFAIISERKSDINNSSMPVSGNIVDLKADVSNESDSEAGVDDSDAAVFEMEAGNFFFSPEKLEVEAGQTVKITFTKNVGMHTFVIDEIGFKDVVATGNTITFTAPEKPGDYAFYCDVGAHRQMGMEGILTVK